MCVRCGCVASQRECVLYDTTCMYVLYDMMRSPAISTAFVTDSEFVCVVCIVSMGVCL